MFVRVIGVGFVVDMMKDSTSGDKKRQTKKVVNNSDGDGDVPKQVPAETPGKRKRRTPAKKRVKKAATGKAVEEEAESTAPAPPSPVVDDGWTPSDVEMLMMAIGACDAHDIHFWRNVALRVPGKTPLECNEKLIRMDLTVLQVKRQQREEEEQEERKEEEEREKERKEKRKLTKTSKRREPAGDDDIDNGNNDADPEEEGEEPVKKRKGRKNDKKSGKTVEQEQEHEQDVQEDAYEEEQSSQGGDGQFGEERSLDKSPEMHRKAQKKKMAGFFSGSPRRDDSESPRLRKKARKSGAIIEVEGIRESRVKRTSEFDAEYRKFHAGDGDDEIDAGIRRLGNKFASDSASSYVLPGEDEADINFGPGLRKPGKVWDWRY